MGNLADWEAPSKRDNIYSEDNEDSEDIESPEDDAVKDPTYKGRVEAAAAPTERSTRSTASLSNIRLSPTSLGTYSEPLIHTATVGLQDKMTSDADKKRLEDMEAQVKQTKQLTTGLTKAIESMSTSFETLSAQGKQNNKTFINDLPLFGIIKEPGNNRNIVPLSECKKFLQLIETATDKNDFT